MEGRRLILAAICAGLWAPQLGCNGELTPEAKELLLSGQQAYDSGEDREAIHRMDAFLKEYGTSRGAAEAYYIRGMAKFRTGDTGGAKTDLNAAAGSAQEAQIRGKALVSLGDLAYNDGELALAENLYRDALASLDVKLPPADRARLRLAIVLQRQGRWADADVHLNRVIYDFHGAAPAEVAAQRVHCVAWTIQAGAFRNKQSANALSKDLAASLPGVSSRPAHRDGVLWHIVQVGRFASYEQAMTTAQNVRRKIRDAFVTVTR